MKQSVDKLPRNQRKDTLKQKMNAFQEMKTKEVSCWSSVGRRPCVSLGRFLEESVPSLALVLSFSCVFFFFLGESVPGRPEELSGQHAECHHPQQQARDGRDGEGVSGQKTQPH